MNGKWKKVVCLALSLAFVSVSSQAQAVAQDLQIFGLNISSEDRRTIGKGLFMGAQDWGDVGMLGIEDNIEKFNKGDISLQPLQHLVYVEILHWQTGMILLKKYVRLEKLSLLTR
jgi:hypothetical protein